MPLLYIHPNGLQVTPRGRRVSILVASVNQHTDRRHLPARALSYPRISRRHDQGYARRGLSAHTELSASGPASPGPDLRSPTHHRTNSWRCHGTGRSKLDSAAPKAKGRESRRRETFVSNGLSAVLRGRHRHNNQRISAPAFHSRMSESVPSLVTNIRITNYRMLLTSTSVSSKCQHRRTRPVLYAGCRVNDP